MRQKSDAGALCDGDSIRERLPRKVKAFAQELLPSKDVLAQRSIHFSDITDELRIEGIQHPFVHVVKDSAHRLLMWRQPVRSATR